MHMGRQKKRKTCLTNTFPLLFHPPNLLNIQSVAQPSDEIVCFLEKHISRQIARNDVFSYVDSHENLYFLIHQKNPFKILALNGFFLVILILSPGMLLYVRFVDYRIRRPDALLQQCNRRP